MRDVTTVPVLKSLYGRTSERKLLFERLDSPEAWCLMFVGDGGIGKTRLLQEAIMYAGASGRPVSELFDFYHVEKFRASQIENDVIKAVERAVPDSDFSAYRRQQRVLNRARQSGQNFRRARDELRAQFVACYNDAADLAQRPILLIFDTLEQAVNLTDEAELLLVGAERNESDGGEFWLRTVLPKLRRTQIILSGRPRTLYGDPVGLYDDLLQAMGHRAQRYPLEGIEPDAVPTFLHEIRQNFLASPIETVRMRADAVVLDEGWIAVFQEVASGQPFWLTMLFTSMMLAVVPREVDELRDAHLGLQPPGARDEANGLAETTERIDPRTAIMRELLGSFADSPDGIVLALRWMATARKGLSREMFRWISSREVPELDADTLFDLLRTLLVVKSRTVFDEEGAAGSGALSAGEQRLFLHDEMYRWLDDDHNGAVALRQPVSEALIDWYNTSIADTQAARLAAIEQSLEHPEQSAEARAFRALARGHQRYERQLVLDRLGYYYQQDLQLGQYEYNLRAYDAIVTREYGYGVILRQEALRNLYRLGGLTPEVTVECAARWVLRAVWSEDKTSAMKMLPLLQTYASEPGTSGLPYALLRLAEARVWFEFTNEHGRVRELLDEAEEHLAAAVEASPEQGLWTEVLQSEIYNYRGLQFRRQYELFDAIEQYRDALRIAVLQPYKNGGQTFPGILPDLLGRTLNNLAFAYSEQGNVREARRYAVMGLNLNLRFNTAYFMGLSYNTLARIEIRAGQPWLAQVYATRARAIFDALESPRGRSLSLPVLAETHRKIGEALDADRPAQRAAFATSKALYFEAIDLLTTEGIVGAERWREALQGLGCAYRSQGQALLRHGPRTDQVREEFQQAHRFLRQALEHAISGGQPSLIVMDIYEDLAVMHVNEDEFDQRITAYLEQAERLAPDEYKLAQGEGLRELTRPVRGFWRELGQCELQRMLASFGAYDFGWYHYDQATGARILEQAQQTDSFERAACHMVRAFAYLLKYDAASAMVERAVYLALRELRQGRTKDQIKLMLQAAFKEASDTGLLESEAFALTERLMQQALEDAVLVVDSPGIE